jgi:antitoxin CcdA
MSHFFDLGAPRKPANLSINSDLLRIARDNGINLSATLEQALIEQLKHHARKTWQDENQEAIATYNTHVDKNGVFSDNSRSF